MSSPEMQAINRIIENKEPAAQRRIHVIAHTLRQLLERDEAGEAECALTLVMAELADQGVES